MSKSGEYPREAGRSDVRRFLSLIADPHFQTFAKPLGDWIRNSIAEQEHPLPLLDLQQDMASHVIKLADQRRSFRAELTGATDAERQTDLERAIGQSSRAIRMIGDIADGIAWRALGYRRAAIRQLAAKPQNGAMELDSTAHVLAEAYRHARATGDIVVCNDLTNCLRHGDYTAIGADGVSVGEVKSGPASAKNSRAGRQRQRLDRILENLNAKRAQVPGGATGQLLELPIRATTHVRRVTDLLIQTRDVGIAADQISGSIAVAVARMTVVAELQIEPGSTHHPFPTASRVGVASTLDFFGTWPSEIAPISVFPYAVEDRAALLTGDLSIVSHCNLDNVVSAMQRRGLTASLPSREELKHLQSLRAGERAKRELEAPVTITRPGSRYVLRAPFVIFSRITLEFLDEDCLAELLAALVDGHAAPGYVVPSFENEHELWD